VLLAGAQAFGATSTPPDPAIEQAIADALRIRDPNALWVIQGIQQSGDWAIGFVAERDPRTGQLYASDIEVPLVQRTGMTWTALLHGDPLYDAWLNVIPEELLSRDLRDYLRPQATAAETVVGYRLPWPAGQQAHARQHTYAAVDIDIHGWPTVGTIRAAKNGHVVYRKDTSTIECGYPPNPANCPWQGANIVVIQSAATEYVWYMHLQPGSIPAWIQVGTWVYGGMDIGLEGETGWATAPHDHFQVATTYSCCSCSQGACAPHWPTVTAQVNFDEVPWGGVTGWLTSQNAPPLLPQQGYLPLVLRFP
jgi:hypothetical protein